MNELVNQAKRGDPDAFTELMRSQMQNMYKAARAILNRDEDVADAISDTILACWEHLGSLKQAGYFRTWMTRILINKCYEQIRKNKPVSVQDQVPDYGYWENKYENIEWTQTLDSLPQRYRLAMIAVLAVGTVSVYAAYINWSQGLKEELQITQEQQESLQENGMAAFADASVTDAGITVSAQQSITDNYYTYLSFKVEGYHLEDGKQPDFENVFVTVDGKEDFNSGSSFYNGIIAGNDGMGVYADGSALETRADGSTIQHYVMDDGSMEYHMVLGKSDEKGYFIGKKLHVEFKNLGTVAKAEYFPDITGKWDLDMTLGGADTSTIIQTDEKIGDTGLTLTSVELSPVSIRVSYDADQEAQVEEVPMPTGLVLKDGTKLEGVYGGPGSSGMDGSKYICTYAFEHVIDPDQVAAVLIPKNLEGSAEGQDTDYYQVAIQ